ncbi:hypothetical protein AB8B21_20180 [Tardiphaga sp. 866_E4_N2_1]
MAGYPSHISPWSAPLPGGPTRACEMMDFDADHQIVRSEAYYGAGS